MSLFRGSRQLLSIKPMYLNHVKTAKTEFRRMTMNDLPNPEGDWYTLNNARQRRHNMTLVIGVGFFLFSLAFGLGTNMFELYYEYPEVGEKIDNYQEAKNKEE